MLLGLQIKVIYQTILRIAIVLGLFVQFLLPLPAPRPGYQSRIATSTSCPIDFSTVNATFVGQKGEFWVFDDCSGQMGKPKCRIIKAGVNNHFLFRLPIFGWVYVSPIRWHLIQISTLTTMAPWPLFISLFSTPWYVLVV